MKQAPVSWFERKQTPRIPYETVWVSSDGSMHFPNEMATDHIVNALNCLLRQKRDRLTLAALASDNRETGQRYTELAGDIDYLRSLVLHETPVAAEMESVVLRRQVALNE